MSFDIIIQARLSSLKRCIICQCHLSQIIIIQVIVSA